MSTASIASMQAVRIGVEGRHEVIDLSVGESIGAVIRSAIGCRWFDVVRLTPELDMWIDDEGAVLADAQVNVVATAIARVHGAIWQPFCGVAVSRCPRPPGRDCGPLTAGKRCPAVGCDPHPHGGGEPMTPTTAPTTATTTTIPTPEAYMSQAERALKRGTHYIEESIWVYLMRDWDGTDRWVLDPVTVDGCGLDSGLEDGDRNSECMCDNQAECDTIRERMDKVYLPTAEELMYLLAESLGYTVTKVVRS